MIRMGPYERLVAGAETTTVIQVPLGVVEVTAGDEVNVYFVTFRDARICCTRVLALSALFPGEVISFAASYAARFTLCFRKTALDNSTPAKIMTAINGRQTAVSMAATPRRNLEWGN